MIRRNSINRPPTPDARDDDHDAPPKEPTLHEIVNLKLIESGEKERLIELVRERLVECGWKDEMRTLCRAFVKKNGRDNVTVDDLVRAITPKGRASIPDSVKAELLQKIRSFLVSVAH
ncbi:transcription and mRNA export factor ENY2-like [Salvia splendens]|uniref:transcription and mRNA export factor ENY2-like n=1 Tax=Salvia splendens TaxID=180675 RepID=UPI001C262EDD|nr:transcription and mRNA export factor ENY2-like [Salvia splendens]